MLFPVMTFMSQGNSGHSRQWHQEQQPAFFRATVILRSYLNRSGIERDHGEQYGLPEAME